MNIEKTLKKNKISKVDFMIRAGYKNGRNFQFALKNNPTLSDTLYVMLLEKKGINIEELIKDLL